MKLIKIIPYFNKKYYHGHIRWLLTDKNGGNVCCCCCGNIANGIGKYKYFGLSFTLPLCKVHLRPLGVEMVPCIIDLKVGGNKE